jgi:hypothetical protein
MPTQPGLGRLPENKKSRIDTPQNTKSTLRDASLDRLRTAGMGYARVTTGGDPAHAPARRGYEKAGFGADLPSVTYHREL